MPPRLEQRVLVLNRLWQPVNIVGVLRAMSLLFRGRASAIYSDPVAGHRVLSSAEWLKFSAESPPPDGESVRPPCIVLRVPRVLLLGEYDRVPRREIRFSSRNEIGRAAWREGERSVGRAGRCR